MAKNVQNNLVTSLDPSPINKFDNTIILDTSNHTQVEINDSPFTSSVREILKRDHASSPYTPHRIKQALREYR